MPATTVARSDSISRATVTGLVSDPASTRLAGASAEEYGSPQQLTWNIGVSGSTTSPRRIACESTISAPIACRTTERCEYTTAFGRPVVPLVKQTEAALDSESSGSASTGSASARSSSYLGQSANASSIGAPSSITTYVRTPRRSRSGASVGVSEASTNSTSSPAWSIA